ncbi:MAG TPA: hypothetical protein VFW66_10540 [Gemmatimonadales bacterium]|nr:hypothetical protein [Gemmatimonadales bacterium]
MTDTAISLALNHLRAAIRNTLILLPVAFFQGMIAAWALSQWRITHAGAFMGLIIAAGAMIWMTWTYYRTRGLMHRGGVR